jgi:hypothetical protein
MPKPKKNDEQTTRVTFPLPGTNQCTAMVNTCNQQVATILANPDVTNHPEVKAAADAVSAQAKTVGKTMTDLGTARAGVVTLEETRDKGAVQLRRLHGNLVALVNLAAAGNKQAALAWGGKIASRTTMPASTDAPVNVTTRTTETLGSVEVQCKSERGVVCYLFQMGSDPAHPEGWAPPAIVGGCKHTVDGLTVGATVYFRAAIVRRGNVQGQWSDVTAITVR